MRDRATNSDVRAPRIALKMVRLHELACACLRCAAPQHEGVKPWIALRLASRSVLAFADFSEHFPSRSARKPHRFRHLRQIRTQERVLPPFLQPWSREWSAARRRAARRPHARAR